MSGYQLELVPPPPPSLAYYAGYSWGMPLGEQRKYCAGVVVTAKYRHDLASEIRRRRFSGPIVIDNGAFSAWWNREPISLSRQISDVLEAARVLGCGSVARIITPDKVADAGESWRRTLASLPALARFKGRLLLPVQDDSDIRQYLRLASRTGSGIFVGGSSKEFKRHAVEYVRALDPDVYLHVGRISEHHELKHAHAHGVDSFDTTTLLQQRNRNKAIAWRDRFRRYVMESNQLMLLSGGADSAAVMALCARQITGALFVDYGQAAAARELEAARVVAERFGVPLEVRRVPLELGDMGEGKGARVVPARNAALVMLASNFAAARGYSGVLLGAQSDDLSDYADCRPDYVEALDELASPFGVRVCAPLLDRGLSRADVALMVRDAGLSSSVWSCYLGGPRPCGVCPSCLQS